MFTTEQAKGLTKQEITWVVNRYIGVKDGYLGDFNYRTHEEFYPEYCGLDIDPSGMSGTTRARFVDVLASSTPDVQTKILRGVLKRFPIGGPDAPSTRDEALRQQLEDAARRLEGASPVAAPQPEAASSVVLRALGDAEALLKTRDAVSVVDRVHTALHGYLRDLCRSAQLVCADDAETTALIKVLRQEHPAFRAEGARADDITKMMRGLASIIDAMSPVRNKASVAHPNDSLLGIAEAMLVVNAVRTIFHYLDSKAHAGSPACRTGARDA